MMGHEGEPMEMPLTGLDVTPEEWEEVLSGKATVKAASFFSQQGDRIFIDAQPASDHPKIAVLVTGVVDKGLGAGRDRYEISVEKDE